MTIVAHSRPFVVGVDTHAKTHTYAVIETASGQLLGCQQFPTTPPGIARAIGWAGRLTGGEADALWSIEGVATYGARLARAAAESGYEVVEAPRISATDPPTASASPTPGRPRDRSRRAATGRGPSCVVPAPTTGPVKRCACWSRHATRWPRRRR